jgi:hypothetical protein
MSFSFSSLVRLLVLLAMGSTMIAVGVARLDPPRPIRRMMKHESHVNISEYYLDVADRTPRWLDVETGRVLPLPMTGGDVLDAASTSPWVDEQGERQVVGRWSRRTLEGTLSTIKDIGLGRYSFPKGEPLDLVSTEIVPVGQPCWFPGTGAKVLFTAGDGLVYRYAFEEEKGADDATPSRPSGDRQPRPVTWRCEKPGVGDVFLSDLSFPSDPRMSGCVVAALREQERVPGQGLRYTRTRLYWLKLNHAGTEVVEAGRLVEPDAGHSHDGEFDERAPSISTLSDGSLALAYLRQHAGRMGWELRIAPVNFPGDPGVPRVLETSARLLSSTCQPSHPAFSSDGRWLSVVIGLSPSDAQPARIATVDQAEPIPLQMANLGPSRTGNRP